MLRIDGERMILRDFSFGDWVSVHEYASQPAVTRYMAWGPNSEEQTKSFVHSAIRQMVQKPRCDYTLGAELKGSGRIIGTVSISVENPVFRKGDIGYCFHPDYWGQGYGTEAATLLLAFGFGILKLHRIYATCDPRNSASARLLERIGMKREGLLRHDMLLRDGWRDSYIYAIIEDDYKAEDGEASR